MVSSQTNIDNCDTPGWLEEAYERRGQHREKIANGVFEMWKLGWQGLPAIIMPYLDDEARPAIFDAPFWSNRGFALAC